MDPRLIATPPASDVARALALWPELAGSRVRPLVITAFGRIFVETDQGGILLVDPIGLTCKQVARSSNELQQLFSDPSWAREQLLVDVALLAHQRRISRPTHQVFAIAPHPCFTGKVDVDHVMLMDLYVWHHISLQTRGA